MAHRLRFWRNPPRPCFLHCRRWPVFRFNASLTRTQHDGAHPQAQPLPSRTRPEERQPARLEKGPQPLPQYTKLNPDGTLAGPAQEVPRQSSQNPRDLKFTIGLGEKLFEVSSRELKPSTVAVSADSGYQVVSTFNAKSGTTSPISVPGQSHVAPWLQLSHPAPAFSTVRTDEDFLPDRLPSFLERSGITHPPPSKASRTGHASRPDCRGI